MTINIIGLSINDTISLIANKKISAVEIVKQYLKQIELFNSQINAIVELHAEEALEQARLLDEKQARGEALGPLHGIPFTVKDIFNANGFKTTAGSLGLATYRATQDATFITRLKAAGGILLGKTNTPEFENSADTDNLVYGPTKNPYDLTRSAGGSSGGDGAAVAFCFCVFSIGADHGGSLRIPAHYNGITTIRSTVRRIPSTGVVFGDKDFVRSGYGASFNTEGPLARYIDDLEIIVNVMQGPDNIDLKVKKFPLLTKSNKPFSNIKCAYSSNDGNVIVSNAVKQAVEAAANVLATAGASIVNTQPTEIGKGFELYQKVSGPLAIQGFTSLFKRYSVNKRSFLIEQQLKNFETFNCDESTLEIRKKEIKQFKESILKFFEDYDIFICPVTARDALPLTTPMWVGQVNLLSFCWDTSAAKLPSVVVRSGPSENNLPIGVQIVTKPGDEGIALAVAKKIEDVLGGWKMPTAMLACEKKLSLSR